MALYYSQFSTILWGQEIRGGEVIRARLSDLATSYTATMIITSHHNMRIIITKVVPYSLGLKGIHMGAKQPHHGASSTVLAQYSHHAIDLWPDSTCHSCCYALLYMHIYTYS